MTAFACQIVCLMCVHAWKLSSYTVSVAQLHCNPIADPLCALSQQRPNGVISWWGLGLWWPYHVALRTKLAVHRRISTEPAWNKVAHGWCVTTSFIAVACPHCVTAVRQSDLERAAAAYYIQLTCVNLSPLAEKGPRCGHQNGLDYRYLGSWVGARQPLPADAGAILDLTCELPLRLKYRCDGFMRVLTLGVMSLLRLLWLQSHCAARCRCAQNSAGAASDVTASQILVMHVGRYRTTI